MFPVDLVGPRLRLREFSVADAEAYLSLITHPDVFDSILDEERATLDMVVTLLTERHRAAQETDRKVYELAVTLDGRLIGSCGLSNFHVANRRAELGYLIHPEQQRKGYASEAAKLIIQFGFRELGLHRIEATTAPNNAGSSRVLEKIGMTYEGLSRDYRRVRGVWRDSLRYAILATDTGAPAQ
ncbi:MAG TPA: GNAT family N-acetyltransferase [Micromonosporaceae bacterium]|nr:GNAT family N-acetyltransferase [Micromonosporaceae bacterium]